VASEVEQVLVNVIRNAAQAIRLANILDPQIMIEAHADATWLYLSIQDNGPGIPEAVRKKIFEPFFTTKRAGEGIGLGLSLCYHIITARHQGHMQIDSEPGKGANFIITLPLKGEGD
jgi:signal transduction histidine kinase